MIIDAENQVSDAQAVTVTAVSTDAIDLGASPPDIAVGEPLAFSVTVDVAADFTTTDETYQFDIVDDSVAALSSPAVLSSRAILAADLTAGSKHAFEVPMGTITQQFLGLQYTTGGTTPTITVTAQLLPRSMVDPTYSYYASGFSV